MLLCTTISIFVPPFCPEYLVEFTNGRAFWHLPYRVLFPQLDYGIACKQFVFVGDVLVENNPVAGRWRPGSSIDLGSLAGGVVPLQKIHHCRAPKAAVESAELEGRLVLLGDVIHFRARQAVGDLPMNFQYFE